ncbi:MAG: hypothetical protein IPH06_02235 [Alphaproteobacteria bacterium]|jgi:4-amino-4-deoxy-L-arabinose transferase-like glycosyltransferase|nr:hypothetical protein [Alphaproteobacteria bacterium]QQS56868.1 MAG: hypothetical protein IPN28_11490 [Alphaproteobacteria bacterium]
MGNSSSDSFKIADSGIFDDIPNAPLGSPFPVTPKPVPVEHDPSADFPDAVTAFHGENDILVFLYHCSVTHSVYFILSAIATYFLFFGKKRWHFGLGVLLATACVFSLAGGFLNSSHRLYPPHFAVMYSLVPVLIAFVFKLLRAFRKQNVPLSIQEVSKSENVKSSKFRERLKNLILLVAIACSFYLGIYLLSYGGCKFNAIKFSERWSHSYCVQASLPIALGALFLLCCFYAISLFLNNRTCGQDRGLRGEEAIDCGPLR